jgi:hypothetical protein
MVYGSERTEVDIEQYSPLRSADRKFDISLVGEEIRDSKGKKVGKVLGSQYNAGTALIDMTKVHDNGPHETYYLSDYRCLIW